MSSLDFKLAMMTARTVNITPRKPVGGVPAFTVEDVRLGVSMIRNPGGFHALMSKYCDDDQSTTDLLRRTAAFNMKMWFDNPHLHHVRVSRATLDRITELSVLAFLSPSSDRKRGVRGHAAFCGVAPNTWTKHFSRHHKGLVNWLVDIEIEALQQLKGYLK